MFLGNTWTLFFVIWFITFDAHEMHVALMKVLKTSSANRKCSVCLSDFLYMGSVKKEESQSVFFCMGRLLFLFPLLMVRVRPD